MILKPIQSRNVIMLDAQGKEYTLCHYCENIEGKMSKNILPLTNIRNGWEFEQRQNVGAQNFYYQTSIDTFLKKLLISEVKNTYWCLNCGSLSFSKIYASVVSNTRIDIGFSAFVGEPFLDNVEFSLGQDFTMALQNNPPGNAGKFFIYGDTVTECNLIKVSTVEANIINILGGPYLGSVKFNLATKKLTVSFNDKTNTKFTGITSYVISLDFFNSTLTTTNIKDYDTISAKITYNDTNVDNLTGCYIKTFNNK